MCWVSTSRGLVVLAVLVSAPPAFAQGVRSHTRPTASTTAVTQTQASELSLTLTEVAVRPIQAWVRTAGHVSGQGLTLTMTVPAADAAAIRVGQRIRCFSVAFRSQMHQGRITRMTSKGGVVLLEASLADDVRADGMRFVVEIVVDRGDYLSVPNGSIIEEGDRHLVYVQTAGGKYTPKPVLTGLQGELYTQVLAGVEPGDHVVSIGSFFIDAETKLKAPAAGGGMSSMPGMEGMDMSGMGQGK